MVISNGSKGSEVPSGFHTSEDIGDCGQRGPSFSELVSGDTTPSVRDDVPTEKGSNLSRTLFSSAAEFSKKGIVGGASQGETAESSNTRFSSAAKTSKKGIVGGASQEATAGSSYTSTVEFREWRESRCQFSEAGSDTAWYQAIERRDCKTLMSLLNGKEGCALWKEKGKAGRTVLHVAAMQGSVKLVRNLKNVLEGGNFDFGETILDVKDERCDMTAVEIAERIVGYKDIELLWGNENVESFESLLQWQSEYSLTEGAIHKIKSRIDDIAQSWPGKDLMDSFKENVDYNFCDFEVYGWLFVFHHACSRLDGLEFVVFVLKEFDDDARLLLHLRDFQGRTPVHVAVAVAHQNGLEKLLRNLIFTLQFNFNVPLDVPNGRGWSLWHLAATQPYTAIYEELVFDSDLRGNIHKAGDLGCRNFCHLAVLHNNPAILRKLLSSKGPGCSSYGKFNVNNVVQGEITIDDLSFKRWTLLSLALMLGSIEIMEILMVPFLSDFKEDQEQLGICAPPHTCLAAAMGNTEVLRMCIDCPTLDPLETDQYGRTALHYAANGLIEPRRDRCAQMVNSKRPHTFVCVEDVPDVAWFDELYDSSREERQIDERYSGRRGCINMLLQVGVDIWQKDNKGKIASIGRGITNDDFISWWHEKIAKETLDMRNNLNQGGNAISVIAALIATASYVGPLQPPLTYGPDPLLQNAPSPSSIGYARVWYDPVKVFMVCNSLSFYLAIASIMLAVVPSVPMRQEALLKELERTRETMAIAISVLLGSIVGILISYAAASKAVIPSHDMGLMFLPTVLGVMCCSLGMVLFKYRVVRLTSPNWCRWLGKQFTTNRVFNRKNRVVV